MTAPPSTAAPSDATTGLVRRVLAGPALNQGAESLTDHVGRLGPLVHEPDPTALINLIEASGLLGRGGAGFPVGRKWRSVAERAAGRGAIVLVNGAEGEPLSHKDRAVMSLRPHLVLDGAELAARAVGADEIVVYVGSEHRAARQAMRRAVGERAAAAARNRRRRAVPVRLAVAPNRYVAGEESAAVNLVNTGDARPVTTPPRPYERGVAGRPTVVQNVESLAQAALIARFGPEWYRSAGRASTPGTALVSLTLPNGRPIVREIELGVTIGELARAAEPGARPDEVQAVLIGGYFGGWVGTGAAWDLPLDPAVLRARGLSIGAGVVALLGSSACPVQATAQIAEYMAAQSAAQCGPCVYGLRSIADAASRIARLEPYTDDLANLERWAGQVRNRGACRHPDGAIGLLVHGLDVFGAEFLLHQRNGRCSRPRVATVSGRVA